MVAILCYHKVGPLHTEGKWLNVPPETLARQIRFFQKRHYTFLAAKDIPRHLAQNPNPKTALKAVCLTFDDAYQSMLEHGIPVLQSAGVTATIYAVTSQIAGTSVWDTPRNAPLADAETLREAQRQGFEIGNHTHTHPFLSRLTPEEQTQEIQTCHESLRQLGLEPGSFCLPYGDHSPETPSLVRQAGYQVALSTRRAWATPQDNPLLLPRFGISSSDKTPSLIYKLHLRPRIESLRHKTP